MAHDGILRSLELSDGVAWGSFAKGYFTMAPHRRNKARHRPAVQAARPVRGARKRALRTFAPLALAALLTARCVQPDLPVPQEGAFSGPSDTIEEVLRITDRLTLEESDSVITVVPHVTIGRDFVWIADESEAQIRKYTREGQLVAAFGRRGEGPGELSAPVRLLPLRADTVLVLERLEGQGGLGLWQAGGGSANAAKFLRYLPRPTEARIHDGRVLSANSVLLAYAFHAHPSGDAALTLDVLEVPSVPRGTDFPYGSETIRVPMTIDEALLSAYATAGWSAIDVHGDRIVAAFSLKDTVHLLRHSEMERTSVRLPTQDFQLVRPIPQEAFSDTRRRREWSSSFTAIADLFLVNEDLLLVQLVTYENHLPIYHPLGLTVAGTRRFQLENTPRMLSVDRETGMLLGAAGRDALPNELAWYEIVDPITNRDGGT